MNIVYNASAGTGKTFQVTQLYEKLVIDDGIDPREILLMTFTDNAAAELRMRVAHRLLKARRIAEAEGNDERAERAIAASSKLSSAPIGTIHSFCTRLLREHALEAALSPGFSVLVGDERDNLLNRTCREELLAALDADPDFKTFCAGVHILGTGRGFGTSITETVPKLMDQASSLGISLKNAETLLPDPLPPVSIDEFRSILGRLQELPKRTKKVEEAIGLLTECLAETHDACGLADQFDKKFSGHFSYGDAKTIYPEFKALKEETRCRKRYSERFPAAKAFARYVQAVVLRFEQSKHEMNAVDFDDQLRLAAQLLKSGKAAPEFSHIIVDEVQDTSRTQCDIIQSLWTDKANLVICGDKKQSIYTWRGADPQVMPDLEQAILAADGKPEHLQTSYRSKPQILEVVNRLFDSVYDNEAYTPSDRLQPNPGFITEGEKPCIEFLTPDEDDEEWSKQEKVVAEMEAIANRIRLLVEGPSEWQPTFRYADGGFQATSKSNAYRYSDILILLHRTTHQSALEQALRHAGIPYTLGGKGRGLFTRQETRDISLFLNVLTNPKDAYSLIGFLRSPWVGLSDESIAELAWSEGGFSVDCLMERYPERTTVIDRYRELLGRKLASELVRMLIDETGYDALLAGLPRGTQRLANLRKVLDWLRETERGAHTTPAAVARKMAEQIANPPKIPEAALLDPAQNAVTIMTVHGAKGLTKRVVFVPDMSFTSNPDRSFAQVFFDERHQPTLGLRITAPDRSGVKSPGFEAASKNASNVRTHEYNNLFYVAMTRARDLVVTSASTGKRSSGWLTQIEPMAGKEIPALPYATLQNAVTPPKTEEREPAIHSQLAAALESLPPPPNRPILQRLPATRLAKEQDEIEPDYEAADSPILQPRATSAAMGSLGHAVLEQLALNDWQGSIRSWLETFRYEFEIAKNDAATLKNRIEQTREMMVKLTGDMQEMLPEFPFVLHEGDRLIDGSIDLLCRTSNGFAIFDYKFTEASETELVEQYRTQMEIYRLAAEKCFPYAGEARTELIVISSRDLKRLPIVF